jgi:hypothetical protein
MTNRRVAGLLALSALAIGPLVACADNGPADTGQTSTSPSPATALTSPRAAPAGSPLVSAVGMTVNQPESKPRPMGSVE